MTRRRWKDTKATFQARIAELEGEAEDAAKEWAILFDKYCALRLQLAALQETEWRMCWWSSLIGSGVTLAGLWLGGLL